MGMRRGTLAKNVRKRGARAAHPARWTSASICRRAPAVTLFDLGAGAAIYKLAQETHVAAGPCRCTPPMMSLRNELVNRSTARSESPKALQGVAGITS